MTKHSSTHHHPQDNLRNFDLTVDEIKLMKTINNMTTMVERIEQMEPRSVRVRVIRANIRKLQEQLDDLRDNTLIR
jgi:hypothetical protein